MFPNNEVTKKLNSQCYSKNISNLSMNKPDNYKYAPTSTSKPLLNNFNIIKYNNINFPRLNFNDSEPESEYLINIEIVERQMTNFHHFLIKNNITQQRLFPNYYKMSYFLNSFYPNNSSVNLIKGWNELKCNNLILVNIIPKTDLKTTKIKENKSNFSTNEINENIEIKMEIDKPKRGRKSNGKKVKPHTAACVDNIIRKIQVNFLSFVIYYANDLMRSIIPRNQRKKLKFNHLQYKLKNCINLLTLNCFRRKTMGEILQMKETNKNKGDKSITNKDKYFAFRKMNNAVLENFFNKTYVYIFENYYMNEGNLEYFENVKINTSFNTKNGTFNNLREHIPLPDEKVTIIVRRYFIDGYKLYKNKFKVKKLKLME